MAASHRDLQDPFNLDHLWRTQIVYIFGRLPEFLSNIYRDKLPSLQQALVDENRANELLDGSLKLVDICGIARDVIFLTKESVQELESSLRRNRGIDAYMTSRKKIDKMVKKCIQNLKSFDPCSTSLLNKDSNLKAIHGKRSTSHWLFSSSLH
ncbi:hypothetical protein Fot_51654 [Forsythia ovata]|uniref:Uncharacterized protein n=1 Tax=Forsythia ovata TaxID=205694 RepID=A0ABD1PYW8_9LAMI